MGGAARARSRAALADGRRQTSCWQYRPQKAAERLGGIQALCLRLPFLTHVAGSDYRRSFVATREEEETEAELRGSDGRFRLVANTSPIMIWISDTDKLCPYFNKPWRTFRTIQDPNRVSLRGVSD